MSTLGYPSLSPRARGRTAGATRKPGPEAASTGLPSGVECLESGASPGIELIDFVRGLRVGQFGVKRNRHQRLLAVLSFWGGLLASLPLGLSPRLPCFWVSPSL